MSLDADRTETTEDLLWDLAGGQGTAHSPSTLSDERLMAYRSGKLAEADQNEVEAVLAQDPAARERLRKLAGTELEMPSDELRARILSFAPKAEHAPGPASNVVSFPGPRVTRVLAMAAALTFAVLGAVFMLRQPSLETLPDGFEYGISATGLAEVRSTTTDEVLQALPQTVVRLTAAPVGPTISDLEFNLYREEQGRLSKLSPHRQLELETHRGTATFSAKAQFLVGEQPGTYTLRIAISRPGAAPSDGVSLAELDREPDPAVLWLRQELVLLSNADVRNGPGS